MKILFILFISLMLVALFIGIIMKIPRLPFIGGSEDGWFGFWGGILGSLMGVIGAYFVMKEQLNVEKKEQEKKLRPIITLGKGHYTTLTEELLETELLKIPIINGGQTPIFNITLKYDFINEELLTQDTNEKIELNGDWFTIGSNMIFAKSHEMAYLPVLMPGEHSVIACSSIVSEIFFYCMKDIKKSEYRNIKDLKFKILLDYQDYNNENKKKEFTMSIIPSSIIFGHNQKPDEIRCYLKMMPSTTQ
ncbi:hypothetical protein [Candidatus Enterococcus huntleyi]|uniref:hypothetical protein n=1 Tax=Candidatus Enterococcus huntleyi TaxID=1857217 RepID=UPI001379684D|nr:hypothetical protein [Enterococcus sp. JM4C]